MSEREREQGILISNLGKLEEKLIEFGLLRIIVVEVVQDRSGDGLMQKLHKNILKHMFQKLCWSTGTKQRQAQTTKSIIQNTNQQIGSKRRTKDEEKTPNALQGYCGRQ